MRLFIRCGIVVFIGSMALAERGTEILKGHPPVDLSARLGALPENKRWSYFSEQIRGQVPLHRGTNFTQGPLLQLYEKSLENLAKTSSGQGVVDWLDQEGDDWLTYFERLSYEEGRFAVLVDVIKLRTRIWQGLANKLSQKPSFEKAILPWLEKRKPVFPIDRIFLLEAKAKWPGTHMRTAEKITQMLSGRPGLSLRVVGTSLKVPRVKEIIDLEKEWSDSQLDLMKAELAAFDQLILSLRKNPSG